ncbi:MAG TPA: hypothetical protein VMV94_16800 [Phycisphaerae bacterium]|nr:hypothetical protein [Phycisphaerae bacterium]
MMTDTVRLASLPLTAKLLLTPFLALIGCGYFVALLNIYEHHQDADLEPGLTFNDLRRVYHGIDKLVTSKTQQQNPSPMQKMTSPGGKMRPKLEKGGEPAVRALTRWLADGAQEADFARAGVYQAGDPSVKQVIAQRCIECHNATDGEESDVPYAQSSSSEPEYVLVIKEAAPELGPVVTESKMMHLAPKSVADLVQITHAHILAMPVFTVIIGGLFLLTGLPQRFKLVVGPLPMVAMCFDFASWWLARPFEPFVYVIAAAGAVFGASLGVQILCVSASLWFGKKTT